MNGIHDLGGADGFGPVLTEEDEPVWHAEWEKAAFAFFAQSAAAGYFNLDEFRASIERMDPVDYLTHPYYAHWMHAFEEYLARENPGFPAELERRTAQYLADPSLPLPETVNPDLVKLVETMAFQGGSTRRDIGRPAKFKLGDRVLVSPTVPVGHTRKAGYVRGAVGEITAHHGVFVFPDTASDGRGENPDHVYTVLFSSEDLFGSGIGDPKTTISIDLWEPYITHVSN
ncbi:nitrile hydratase subunit beta [Pseudarthrobacter sp. NPDC058329]|uniref:nitrile hydratase subunit beta n=1 Tax=Pseudarthrobacter sp. NPDC058329 TaxID=3346448 RepID=UPI0036DEDC52